MQEDELLYQLLSKKNKIKKWRINMPFLKESFKLYIEKEGNQHIDFCFLEKNTDAIIHELDMMHKNRIIDLATYQTKNKILEKYMKGIDSFLQKNNQKNERIIQLLKNETNK